MATTTMVLYCKKNEAISITYTFPSCVLTAIPYDRRPEKLLVEQVTHRDKLLANQKRLLAEQQTMIEKIRDLEEQLAESRLDPAPIKSLEVNVAL